MKENPELSDNTVHIDVSLIPPHVQDYLADATLELIHNILSTPEGCKRLEQKKIELGLC